MRIVKFKKTKKINPVKCPTKHELEKFGSMKQYSGHLFVVALTTSAEWCSIACKGKTFNLAKKKFKKEFP